MINEFLSILGKRSYAKPTLFQFEVLTVPELVRSTTGLSDFQRDLKFLCTGVEMPGTQLLTQENRIYDMPSKYAYQKAHDELVITMRVDKDYLSRNFFEAWGDSMYNRNTGNPFYKSKYVGEVRISTMREDGSCPYAVVFEECFPTQIGNISYSWDATGQLAIFTVNMAFTRKRQEAREDLFTKAPASPGGNQANNNIDMGGFDVMNSDKISTIKDNIYSSVNNAFDDRIQQRMAMGSSQLDPSTLKQMFKF